MRVPLSCSVATRGETHIPNVTAAAPDWSGLGWLAPFIVIFLLIAFAGFRCRDIL